MKYQKILTTAAAGMLLMGCQASTETAQKLSEELETAGQDTTVATEITDPSETTLTNTTTSLESTQTESTLPLLSETTEVTETTLIQTTPIPETPVQTEPIQTQPIQTNPPQTEPPQTQPQYQKRFWLEPSGCFRADVSLLGLRRSDLSTLLGISIPQPQEFPYWKWDNIQNTDVSYDGLNLCFMFRNDVLVMIIYDLPTTHSYFGDWDGDIRLDAGSPYNSGEVWEGVYYVNMDNGGQIQMWYDVYQTGEQILHQVYMTPKLADEY